MKLIKILLFCTFILLLPFKTLAFEDVSKDHPYYEAIEWAVDKGYIRGYTDGTFQPEKEVNRAELVHIVNKVYGLENYNKDDFEFSDVDKEDWFYFDVKEAFEARLIKGYEDGTFQPERTINFAEFSKIFYYAAMYPSNLGSGIVTGKGAFNIEEEWYLKYIKHFALSKLILPQIESPNHYMTRGEVIEVIYRSENDLEKDHLSYPEFYRNNGGTNLYDFSLSDISIEEPELEGLHVWAEKGNVSYIFEEYPLPWKISLDGERKVLDSYGNNLTSLLYIDDTYSTHYHDLEIEEGEILITETSPSITDSSGSNSINFDGTWLTIAYENKWVGSLNIKTGDYKLEQMPRFFSDMKFNGSEYFYTESNLLHCGITKEALLIDKINLVEDLSKCMIWVYSPETRTEIALSERMEGRLTWIIPYSMNSNYVWTKLGFYECHHSSCFAPIIQQYDVKTGEFVSSLGGGTEEQEDGLLYYYGLTLPEQEKIIYEIAKASLPGPSRISPEDAPDTLEGWDKVLKENPELQEYAPVEYPSYSPWKKDPHVGTQIENETSCTPFVSRNRFLCIEKDE